MSWDPASRPAGHHDEAVKRHSMLYHAPRIHVPGVVLHSRLHLLPRFPCAARMKHRALLPEVFQARERARSSSGDRSVIRRQRRERAIPIMPAPPPDRFTSFIHCYTASSSLSSSHHSAIHTDFGRDLTLCTQIDNHYTADMKMHRPLITSRAKSRNPLVRSCALKHCLKQSTYATSPLIVLYRL